jgi:adenylate kinase
MPTLYFVGGVFGTGKSTLCQALSRLLPAEHLKASDLIRYAPNLDDATGKTTENVFSNQERLIATLAIHRTDHGTILLDGHFCLLDSTCIIVRLPVSVFQHIQPRALVLVEAGVAEVVDRIKRRDGREIDPTLTWKLLQAEREHSHVISETLDIPIMIVGSSTATQDIVTFLHKSSCDK